MHKRCPQEWGRGRQEESDICRHGGEGARQKWTSTLGSKFKYLIARSR